MTGRYCDQCGVDLWETDPNKRISLVPQAIQGLWPILRDAQEQLDFCTIAHASMWFAAAKKKLPALLKEEQKRDREVTGKALSDADRREEITQRLGVLHEQERTLQA